MSLICPHCSASAAGADRFVVHRNDRDGFALFEYRCGSCGHLDVGGDRAVIAALLAEGVRVLRLERCDAPVLEDVAVDALRALLARDDWLDVLHRGGG